MNDTTTKTTKTSNSCHDLAEFVVTSKHKDFSSLARSRATDAIVDCFGCAFAGSEEPLAQSLLRTLSISASQTFNSKNISGDELPVAPLLGTPYFAGAADAALYNGAIAHALDFDDVAHPAYAHPTAVLLPTALALAPFMGSSGADVITAYILGVEVFGKLGRALNPAHYRRGWHATSTLGSVAAAVCAGRLLNLSTAQMRMAIGMGASSAGGLRASFGTMTKPLHAGYAARNGVVAAMLAREGFTASADSIDHQYGFAEVFNNKEDIVSGALHSWGQDLEILTEFGLALKPFPSCGATHPAIETAILLHQDLNNANIDTADIKSIRVGICEMAFAPLIYKVPNAPLEGKFSMHFVVAAALVDGNVGLSTFSDEKIQSPVIRDLAEKLTMEVDERVSASTEFATIITLETHDGKQLERTVPLASGKPARWFTHEQLKTKFMDCAGLVFKTEQAEIIFSEAIQLDKLANLNSLILNLRE